MSSFSNPFVDALQTFYNNLGAKYDDMTQHFHQETASQLVEDAGSAIREGSWVLDLATGTGNVALAAAAKIGSTGRVLGIDISDKFLEIAAKRAAATGLQEVIEFSHQDVTNLKLPGQFAGARFDAVTCGSAIAMFPDPKAVARIVATELLKPGGVFAADSHGPPAPMRVFFDVAVARGFKPPVDPAWFNDTGGCLRDVVQNSPLKIKSLKAKDVGSGTTKWDISTPENTEKLWKFMIVDASWLSFGLEKLPEETVAEIKQDWLDKLAEMKDQDGIIHSKMTEYSVVAFLKQD